MDPEVIAAAISAAASYFQQQSDTDWKNSVSDKLDLILTKLDQIDAFLHAIPGIFVTLLDAQQRKVWVTQIGAAIKDINDLIQASPHGPTTSAEKTRWENHLDSTKTLLEENMDYTNWGFEQFAIIAVGIAAASGIAKFQPNRQTFKQLVRSALSYYYSAVDVNVNASFARVNTILTAQQNTLITGVNPLFETFWLNGMSDEITLPHGGGPKTFLYTYKCHGSVQQGVTGIDHGSVPDTGRWSYMPGTSGENAESQGVGILTSSASQFKSLTAQIASARLCINACNQIIMDLQHL
jgi:hypothetical protein